MKKLTIVTLSLALSACAPQPLIATMWSKPGANYGAFLQDRSACAQAARIPHLVSLFPGGSGELPPDPVLSGEVVNGKIFWPCMVAHGWSYNPSAWLPLF